MKVNFQEVIATSVDKLNHRQIILYPTDTVWGIGCDATSNEAVKKIYTIKNRKESKSLIILVDSIEMLKRYVTHIPSKIISILQRLTRPTTIIYKNPIGLAENVVAKDNTVAIRIVQNDFCKQLIRQFKKPIVSTSANISGMPTPASFTEINTAILEAVDYVVPLQTQKINEKPSAILKIEGEEVITIRS